eukprot:1219428-Alexandrium_andersonii.AAC.1
MWSQPCQLTCATYPKLRLARADQTWFARRQYSKHGLPAVSTPTILACRGRKHHARRLIKPGSHKRGAAEVLLATGGYRVLSGFHLHPTGVQVKEPLPMSKR